MNLVYRAQKAFRVPDGTLVHPLLNPFDATSGLGRDAEIGVSVAGGTIEPRSSSRVHVHPHVSQVTYVVRGSLTVRLCARGEALEVGVEEGDAVLLPARALEQLVNPTDEPVSVLYIVSPSYVFDIDASGKVRYDDAVTLTQTWDELRESGWRWPPPSYAIDVAARAAALERVRSARDKARVVAP